MNGAPFQFQNAGDAGYDSYSLSSNDSYPLQQSLKQTLLQQIPEAGQQNQGGQSNRWRVPGPYPPAAGADECERLCLEADQLLERSRQQEEMGDLESAFRLCQSAGQCSRAAMDAPYNNPQTLVFARMKHNTCVMRGRSLHRRLLQARQAAGYFDPSTGQQQPYQHNGVAVLPSIDEPRHSRQNSRDSNRSSGSIGGRAQQSTAPSGTVGNIEIYATLPKKKGGRLAAEMKQMLADESSSTTSERQSRPSSVQQQPYNTGSMGRRERAKSEERNKPSSKLPVSSIVNPSNSQSIEDDPSGSDASSRTANNKKQHRIRRRLLMGGLVKRKNRSLPDLRADDQDEEIDQQQDQDMEEPEEVSPYAPTSSLIPLAAEDASNPNLEKSKLMRKSFHSSLGRSIHQSPPNKVPPPPPVRKTSHLTPQTYTVQADVHHERTSSDLSPTLPPLVAPSAVHDPLPPYPAVNQHVRQPSDEFPPPPPPQELQMLSSDQDETDESGPPGGLLAELQRKRKQILGTGSAPAEVNSLPPPPPPITQETGNNRWLQELQATLQSKKMIRPSGSSPALLQQSNNQQQKQMEEDKNKSVRKLASRFEQIRLSPSTVGGGGGVDVVDHQATRPPQQLQHPLYQSQPQPTLQLPTQTIRASPTPAVVPTTSPVVPQGILNKRRSGEGVRHNKNVTFCDQVILVATAEDTEMDETYVPNPILQRVLRSAGFQQQPDHYQQQQQQQPQQPMQFNGTDEVDRPANRSLPPYQKLPMNSQVFQQQQQPNLRAVPASPMMGQRIGPPPGPPPSYAPPPQYPGRPQYPQTGNNSTMNNNNSNAVRSYQAEPSNGKPPFHPQTAIPTWQQQQQQLPPLQAQLSPCSLCGKKQVPSSYQYCSDCQFYMQRFQPKAW